MKSAMAEVACNVGADWRKMPAKKISRKKKRRSAAGALFSRDALWQYVSHAYIAHRQVCVLWRSCGDKPGRAGQVRRLSNQQHCPVLRVLPERLRPVNRSFLDRTVRAVR